MSEPFKYETWKKDWEKIVESFINEFKKLSNKEIINRITIINNPYSPEWVALWSIIKNSGARQDGLVLIKLLESYKLKSQFIERNHCLEAIFCIFNIENKALEVLISGPSTDFNDNYFILGLRLLMEEINCTT